MASVEDIITALSRFKSLFVIARNSTFTYKGKAIDIKQVDESLVYATCWREAFGSRPIEFALHGQLIEADSGTHLWAEKIDERYAMYSSCKIRSPQGSSLRLHPR